MKDVKRCSKCKILSLKSSFNKNTKSKDGLRSQCKFFVYDYIKNYYIENCESELEHNKKYNSQNLGKINEYIKNKMKTDLNFELASDKKNRLYKHYRAQNVRKTNRTFDLSRYSH